MSQSLPNDAGFSRQSKASLTDVEVPLRGFVVAATLSTVQRVIMQYGLLEGEFDALATALGGRRTLIVVDQDFGARHTDGLALLSRQLGPECSFVSRKFRESSKSLEAACEVLEDFDRHSLARRDVVVAIGGGVCCDVTSFAASIYRRGIAHIKVPTTLLGIVDAGIGSKNAVNLASGKNRIGTFYPPEVSLLDPSLSRTQPYEDFRCGLTEMLKVAAASSAELFILMESIAATCREPSDIAAAFTQPKPIELAVRALLEELRSDLYEVGSLRRPADFGHSFSPELEARFNGRLAHGDAVGFEMLLLTEVAYRRRLIDKIYLERVYALYRSLRLPMLIADITVDNIWDGLLKTTLHRGGSLNMPILSRTPGECEIISNISQLSPVEFEAALSSINERALPHLVLHA